MHDLLEWMAEGFIALDSKFRITYFNAASEQSLGTARAEAVGKSYLQVFPELKGSLVQKELTAALKADSSTHFEYFHPPIHKRFLVRAYPRRSAGLCIFFHEITERKQAEYERQTAPQQTFEILESISDGFFAVDGDWRIIYVNGRAEQAWKRRREDLLGRVIWDEFPRAVGSEFFLELRRAAEQQRRTHFMAECPLGRDIEIDACPCAGGLCIYFRRPARGVVSRARRRERVISEQTAVAREEERQRIAREIHDGAGQLLTALSIGIKALEDVRTLDEVKSRLERLQTIAGRTLKELDDLTDGLHPPALRELGLMPALHRLTAEMSESHKLRVKLEPDNLKSLRLPVAAQVGLYRIVQEALSNVVKHSQATRAVVAFSCPAAMLRVEISDNGHGFSLRRLHRAAGMHMGLRSMRERAEILGGRLLVESARGQGTRVIANIPVSTAAQAA